MMNSWRQDLGSKRAFWLAISNTALLIALWLFETRVGEAFWLSGVLCYIPQHLVILPTLFLLLVSLRRTLWKIAAIYAVTLAYTTHIFLGLQIPPSTWSHNSSPPRQKLRAMTYNILGALGGVQNIAATVRAQKPDVLFLQEVGVEHEDDVDPVAPLHKLLPGYNEAREGEVCIFSRFPILAQRSHQFPGGASRFVLEAMLNVRGTPIRVIVVHPYTISFRDPRRSFAAGVANSLQVRNAQIALLLSVIDNSASTWERAWREAPLLVAGDFNTPPRGRVYNALSARLTDSWREAGWGSGNSYSASTPVVRIDYVWHSAPWRAKNAFVPNSRASDHRPLVVDLALS